MEGGTVYILQKFVFHVHCFCCPLLLLSPACFFCLVSGGRYSTVTILILTILERASNESFLSQFHTVVLLY